MRYRLVIPTLYICSTLSLFGEKDHLGTNLLHVEDNEAVVATMLETKKNKKESRFIFKNTETIVDKTREKKVSKKYCYENKSRFKFNFTPGNGYNNMVSSQNKRGGRH